MSSARTPLIAWVIGLISVIPFSLGAYVTYYRPDILSPVSALSLTTIYGGLYLGMIGGSKWGLISAVGNNTPGGFKLGWQMLASVIMMLSGFIAVIMPAPEIGLGILVAGFMLMALWDLTDNQAGKIVFWYAKLRIWLTIFIIAPLISLLIKVL